MSGGEQRFRVHEVFYTLQGEGVHTGRAAVFCRFAGCNLWSGRAEDRASALCRFCDTEFRDVNGPGGGQFSTDELVQAIMAAVPVECREDGRRHGERPYVVFTGGEPALQLTPVLLNRLHAEGFELGVETNGTLPLPAGLDWITVSPKLGTTLAVRSGHELKLVWPQPAADPASTPEVFAGLDFTHFILQPCDGPARDAHTTLCVAYCLAHPRWRFGLQTHKVIGVR